jgi:hypothetical protein
MTRHLSKFGLAISAGYGIVAFAALCFSMLHPHDFVWSLPLMVLTLPWSIVVVLLGFLLIHIDSFGMEYGFAVGALANCIILYFVGAALSSRNSKSNRPVAIDDSH